jgi:uncharacterized protein YbjT (DUF2867 family)
MILVIGATGTTGREVVRELVAAGAPVRAFVRAAPKAQALREMGIEVAIGDLDQPETLTPALAGVDRLFLLTAPDPKQVEQQGRAVEEAQRAGVRHIVKLSALGADADSSVSLARWHAQTEQQIEDSGVDYTHLRPHYFMQNTFGFAASIASEGRFYAPMRDGRISMVDCRDVGAVAARVLTEAGHEGRIYEITGPEEISFHDVAAHIAASTGKSVTYVDVPPSEAEKAMVSSGMPDWLADALNGLFAIFAAGHASSTTSVVPDVTGQPARSFAQFAREHAEVFRHA